MRKAINTGIITGVVLTFILILGTVCRILRPADTTLANLTFSVIFVSAISIALWIAMDRFSRSNYVGLSHLGVLAIFSTITTSILFSATSFVYSRFSSRSLFDLMDDGWLKRSYTSQSLADQGTWLWFKTPWNFAFNNLQIMLLVLFVLSIFVAVVYYSKNRRRASQHEGHNNHELIF